MQVNHSTRLANLLLPLCTHDQPLSCLIHCWSRLRCVPKHQKSPTSSSTHSVHACWEALPFRQHADTLLQADAPSTCNVYCTDLTVCKSGWVSTRNPSESTCQTAF